MSKPIKLIVVIICLFALVVALAACSSYPQGAKLQAGKDDFSNTPSVVEGTNDKYATPPANAPQNDEGDEEETLYLATFVSNGGTAVPSVETLIISTSPQTSYDGYIFAGWFIVADHSTPQVVFPYTLTEDTTFYAKWVADHIIEINTVADLKNIANSMSSSYILMQDLYLNGVDWMPLGMKLKKSDKEGREGKVALDGAIVPFSGTFDGNGFSIHNLTLVPIGEEHEFNYLPYGLFSILDVGGSIKNLTLSSFRLTLDGGFSDFYMGSLVGQMKGGEVRNCHVNGILNNPKLEYEESIWDDFFGSYAEPTENSFLGGMIGGILGGDVIDCSAAGTLLSVSVADGVFTGGLAGFNWDGTVRNSRSYMNVTGRYAGSLIGYNNSGVYDSYATGAASGSLAYPAIAGGLIGYNDINGKIERCYSTGAVTARTAGGLVGVNMFNYSKNSPLNIAGDPIIQALGTTGEDIDIGNGGTIRNCYTTSNVRANEYGGGLIGRAESITPVKGREDIKSLVINSDDRYYFISHCFAFGDVSVIAEEVAYENQDGVMVISNGVYHSVYAGGAIGHASEIRINSVLAFGNVTAVSKRPIKEGDTFMNNSVFADNAIGQSSGLIDQKYYEDYSAINSYTYITSRDVYGSASQVITRNGAVFSGFNTAEALPYSGNDDRNANSVTFLTGRQASGVGLGFDTNIWDFNNIRIENSRFPSIK
ncbi:MAG: InlB B-repeat-containing protein [Clostridia bacterium]